MSAGYDALHSGAGLLDLSTRGRIHVRGRDRARLLHNLTTNNVKKLASGEGCYAFLLNPQGRIQADLHLFVFAEHILLDTEAELREKVPAYIRKYIVGDRVELTDVSGSTAALGLEGPSAAAALAAAGAPAPLSPYEHTAWDDACVAAVSMTGGPGFRIYAPAGRTGELVERLRACGAQPATAAEARVVRIENGVPRYGEDIGDMSLPQETQQMHAVSFGKGCYLGQEIVERIRSRGGVHRKLVRLEVAGHEPPVAGTRLAAGSEDAGAITSAAWSPLRQCVVALGYVRLPHDRTGTALRAAGLEAVVR